MDIDAVDGKPSGDVTPFSPSTRILQQTVSKNMEQHMQDQHVISELATQLKGMMRMYKGLRQEKKVWDQARSKVVELESQLAAMSEDMRELEQCVLSKVEPE